MNEANAMPATDPADSLTRIASSLDVPEQVLSDIYEAERARLASHARITTFISVLAMHNALSLLRHRAA